MSETYVQLLLPMELPAFPSGSILAPEIDLAAPPAETTGYWWTPPPWAAAIFSGLLTEELAWTYKVHLIGVKILQRGGKFEFILYAMREGVELVSFHRLNRRDDVDAYLDALMSTKGLQWEVSRYPHKR